MHKKLRYILPRIDRFRYFNRFRIFDFYRERRIKMPLLDKIRLMVARDSRNIIPFIDIDVTTYCNLKCIRCAKCIPYFQNKRHFSAAMIRENLELLTRYMDTICVASIIGGEPFLNPELKEIIEICAANTRIRNLELTTNATIVPEDELLRTIKRCGVIVHISKYDNIDNNFIVNREKLIERLREFDIPFEFQFHPIWLDFGEIERRNYSDSELERMLIHCPMSTCTVFNDKILYRCGKASYLGQHAMEMETCSETTIDMRQIHSREDMRAALRRFYSIKILPSCRYCLNHPRGIIAAEQIVTKHYEM